MAVGYGAQARRDALLRGSPYLAYTYSYPHKTSYRSLQPPRDLTDVWRAERREALFLYLHVPFCEMRCGFCNLFTYAKPEESLAKRYVDALERQIRVVGEATGGASWARIALGGGTPTQLPIEEMERVLDAMERHLGARPVDVPASVETSPETVTAEKMRLLRERGFDRASIGVQSFVPEETRAVRRPQDPEVAHAAIETMRRAGFPVINVDLIYGIAGQTERSWDDTLKQTLRHEPEEIFLYPLYVRPKTGLGNSAKSWDDERLTLYRRGRDTLLAAGYEQRSMRQFTRGTSPKGPTYRCQEDGMVGLGAGARSYTRSLHYCTRWAVGRRGVGEIIEEFVGRSERDHALANYGVELDADEERRRHAVLSLLSSEGLDHEYYRRRFGSNAADDIPELDDLVATGLAEGEGTLRLTALGVERSDVVGPYLYSAEVRRRMGEFELR